MTGGVLSGIRVVDCSIAMAGPFAAQRLGDLGADVVKVEPITGEWQRHASAGGANGNRINVSFLSLNRNKRSLALNLKDDDGRAVIHRLVAESDVFLQNYRPGVAARLGVDYETLSAINPSLVYVSISGYGEDGPYRDRPGQDLLLQAMSGAMLSTGAAGQPPQPAGQYIADAVTASTAFEAVLAALLHRERTGEGQLVTVNMLDALTTLQMQELSVFTVGGVPQERSAQPHAHIYIRSPYGTFRTSDGWMVIAFPPLDVLSAIIDDPALAGLDDEKAGWEMRDELFARTAERIATRPTAHWMEQFDRAGVWAGPVYSYQDLVDDPQIAHNGTFIEYDHPTEGRVKTPGFPYRFAKTPPAIQRGAPQTGEHSREVLTAIGYEGDDVDRLVRSGVVGQLDEPRGATNHSDGGEHR
ncbi:CoA transferase [Microbacterium sp. EYE_5]|uniref:CaiB/BaiF CoA transferase family protein n=1 Tax=unclassified Microbacterium TaxID=2609290 RepID=UPI0020068878|nr:MULTISPECIES: CoA transferase [unclassified Microbacterium]MCK6079321.1 CoA transferase [Microbacterium sp. EYE_382]MCK6084591.1 CoA transferase [Microbacterium sp. EYE_384]MCK6123180.1 CoA transferase [Microbacterium sp. EYE_80]MCK6125355.1 CoA transferase [Microbacterium sp. EYE_79]MCK6140275.1 CoA transferase [Microbacterium sp. EYE_39]